MTELKEPDGTSENADETESDTEAEVTFTANN